MIDKVKNVLLGLLLIFFLWWLAMGRTYENEEINTSITLLKRDTVRDTIFKAAKEYVVRIDTLHLADTVFVELPISRYEFKDKNYNFVVEGFNVSPILLDTYPTTQLVTKTIKLPEPSKKISCGFILGLGTIYGTKGLDVGLIAGVGLKFSF